MGAVEGLAGIELTSYDTSLWVLWCEAGYRDMCCTLCISTFASFQNELGNY